MSKAAIALTENRYRLPTKVKKRNGDVTPAIGPEMKATRVARVA
jgi:hypothetical protein